MEIIWGDFYFQCNSSTATLIVAIPLLVVFQMPPVVRLLSRLMEKVKRSSAGQRILDRVKATEESE